MKSFLTGLALLLVFVAGVVFSPSLSAQVAQGSIFGTVKDSSGAVVVGVMITVTQIDTGVTRTVTSDSLGQYSVLELPAGHYGLTAQQEGFQSIHLTQMVLAVGQNARYDLNLQIGSAAQTVTVTSEQPLVETTNATLSSEVTNQQLVDLPLNGRSFLDLAQLSPGANYASAAIPGAGVFLGKGPRLSVNGANIWGNRWYLDGALMNDNYNRTPAGMAGVMLGVDAVDEFKTYLSTNGAELAGIGGVIDVITKSGTNNIHGDAFIFARDRALDSRDFFDPPSGPPPFSRQQFGGTVGGPILKDKLFYFVSFEQFRQTASSNVTYEIPDSLAQQGLIPTGTSNVRNQVTVDPVIQQQVFPVWGNLLPTASTPASAEVLNSAGFPTGYDFITGIQRSPITDNNFQGRLDYHPSASDSIFSRFTYDRGTGTVYSGPNFLPNFPEVQYSRGLYFTVGYTRIFKANLVNRATFSYTAPILNSDSKPTGAIPPITVPGRNGYYQQIAISGGPTFEASRIDPFTNRNYLPQFADDVTYTKGTHTIKFGVSYIRYRIYSVNGDNNDGSWTFSSLSSFVQGIPNTVSFMAPGYSTERDFHQRYIGLYVADEWKVLPRVTVNYGLRYDFTSGPSDPQNRESYLPNPFNFPGPCNFSSTAPLGTPGVPFCPGTGPSNFVTGSYWPSGNYYGNYQPRLGVAWDVSGNGKTVIRSGAGIYTQPVLEDMYATNVYTAPATVTDTFGPPQTGPLNANCFPMPITANNLATAACGVSPNTNGSGAIWQGAIKDPTIYRWNLTVERQLDRVTSLSVSYVGSQGRHQPRAYSNINLPTPTYVNGEPVYPGYTSCSSNCVLAPNAIVDNPARPCSVIVTNCFANPNFGTLSVKSFDGYSSYNSLQVQVNRRAKSFNLQASYVWSKCIDSGGAIYNDFAEGGVGAFWPNIALDKGLCGFDIRHRLAANFTYNIPGPSHGFAGKTLGGWQYANNLTIASGPPFGFSSALPSPKSPYQLTPNGPVYAATNFSYIPAYDPLVTNSATLIQPGNANNYINPADIANPLPGYLNTSRWIGTGPGLVVWNNSLIKNFAIKERANLQFRAEVFNVPNHPNLAFPGQGTAAGTASPFYFSPQSNGVQLLSEYSTAGKIISTITPGQGGRQIQLALKVMF